MRRRVLDAGCGCRQAEARNPALYVVGLDLSAEALAENERLDERIVGDVEDYPLEPDSFDQILCQDVFEHLPHPERAFANLARALAPGGELVIGTPNLLSLKGLLTKWTPFGFHRWVYRFVWHSEYEPFPTYLRWQMRPAGLRRAARAHGLEIERSELYSGSFPFFSRLAWRSDYRLVLRKPRSADTSRGSLAA